jgi:hypothetical protein
VVAEGPREASSALLGLLRADDAPGRPGVVGGVVWRWDQQRGGLEGFRER